MTRKNNIFRRKARLRFWLAGALIFSLMTQLNLSTEVQQVTKGLIVLGAVLLQRPEARY